MNNLVSITPAPAQVKVAADLLDTVAANSIDHAISDIEGLVGLLKQNAARAAAARDALRCTPAEIVREAMRVRAARVEVHR